MTKRGRDFSEIEPPTWARDDRQIVGQQDRQQARSENQHLMEQMCNLKRSPRAEAVRLDAIVGWMKIISKKLADAEPKLGRYAKVEDSITTTEKTMAETMQFIEQLQARKEAVENNTRKKVGVYDQDIGFYFSMLCSLAQEQTHNARTGLFPDPDSSQEDVGGDPGLTATPVGLASSDDEDAAHQQWVGSDSRLSAPAVGLPSTDVADVVLREGVGGDSCLSATAVGSVSSVPGHTAAAGGSANGVGAPAVSGHSAGGACAARVANSVCRGKPGKGGKGGHRGPKKTQKSILEAQQVLESTEWSDIGDEHKYDALDACTKDQLRSLVAKVGPKRAQSSANKERLIQLLMSTLEAKHLPDLIETMGEVRPAAKRGAVSQDKGRSSGRSPAPAKRAAADVDDGASSLLSPASRQRRPFHLGMAALGWAESIRRLRHADMWGVSKLSFWGAIAGGIQLCSWPNLRLA